MISLSLIMRLTSWIIAELTHTDFPSAHMRLQAQPPGPALTLFANQGIIAVVGVVRISHGSTIALGQGAEIKFWSVVSDKTQTRRLRRIPT